MSNFINYIGLDFNSFEVRAVLLTLSIIFLTAIALRLLCCAIYQSNLTFFRFNAKPIERREDLQKKTVSQLLNRSIADYVGAATRGAQEQNTALIVDKNVNRLNIIGLSLSSTIHIFKMLEQALVVFALAAILMQPNISWFLIAAIFYGLCALCGAVFDAELVREKLKLELTEYLNREAGQFYVKDLGHTVLSFKVDLESVLKQQSKEYKDSVILLNKGIADTLANSLLKVEQSITKSFEDLTGVKEVLNEPVEKWQRTLNETGTLFDSLDNTMNSYNQTAQHIGGLFESLEGQLKILSGDLTGVTASHHDEIQALKQTILNFEKVFGLKTMDVVQLETQMDFIAKNQLALDKSLQQYEDTLQQMSSKIGTAFGEIWQIEISKATRALNQDLSGVTSSFSESVGSGFERLNALLERLYEQNKTIIQTLSRIS